MYNNKLAKSTLRPAAPEWPTTTHHQPANGIAQGNNDWFIILLEEMNRVEPRHWNAQFFLLRLCKRLRRLRTWEKNRFFSANKQLNLLETYRSWWWKNRNRHHIIRARRREGAEKSHSGAFASSIFPSRETMSNGGWRATIKVFPDAFFDVF